MDVPFFLRYVPQITLVLISVSLYAEPITLSQLNTNTTPIVITASPISDSEQTALDGASSVTVGRAQLERLSATDLPTALRQVPGVTISRYSPIGAYGGAQGGSIYVRGAGTARPGGEVKIYTEGVPRESGVWSHPLMDIVPIDFAENISVAKNPQPQNYPDSFGAIDVSLRQRIDQGHEEELQVAYGRFNTLLAAASAGGRIDLFDYYVGASYKYSEGTRAHSEADLRSLFSRAGWQLSPQDHLSYLFFTSDNWVHDPGEEQDTTPRRDCFNTHTDTHALRLDSAHDRLKGYALIYFEDGQINWHKDHLTDGVALSPPGWSNTDWNNYGFRSSYDLVLSDLTLTAALDTWSEGGQTRNIREKDLREVWGYEGRFFTTAPYVGARYTLNLNDTWHLTPSAGARYTLSDTFGNAVAPCGALTLAREGLQFFLSHARATHYPGIYVRGTSPNTWRDLEPETLDTTETGIHADLSDSTALHASLFQTRVENRMDMTTSGYLNTGSLVADGAELSLHLYPQKDLSLFLGGTYTNPHDHPVSRMPDITASAGGSYQISRYLRGDLDTEYVATQNAYSMRTIDPDLEKIEAFLVVNLRLSLDLRSFTSLDGELYTTLENLTNQPYEYFPGYPMPGMMWYTGAKLHF